MAIITASYEIQWSKKLPFGYQDVLEAMALVRGLRLDRAGPTPKGLYLRLSSCSYDHHRFNEQVNSFTEELPLALSTERVAPPVTPQRVSLKGPFTSSPIQVASTGYQTNNFGPLSGPALQAVAELLASARRGLEQTDLPSSVREDVEVSLTAVDRHLRRPEANPTLVAGLVRDALGCLVRAGAVGQGVDYLSKLVVLFTS